MAAKLTVAHKACPRLTVRLAEHRGGGAWIARRLEFIRKPHFPRAGVQRAKGGDDRGRLQRSGDDKGEYAGVERLL